MDRATPHRCNRYRLAVSLELDGELSQFERAFLTRHGAHCAACQRFKADATAITRDLRSAPLEVPRQRVVVARRRRGWIAGRHATALVASVLAVSFGALYGAQIGAHRQDGTPWRDSTSTPSAPPAYLDSPEYELSMLRPAEPDFGASRVIRL